MSAVRLDLPLHIQHDVAAIAEQSGVTAEQLMVSAITEKVAELRLFRKSSPAEIRAARQRLGDLLDRVPDAPPIPGDELPDDLRQQLEKRFPHLKKQRRPRARRKDSLPK